MSCQPPTPWMPSPGATSCVNCGSPCCGVYATQEDCEDVFNDDWLGLPRWFWYGLLGTLTLVFLLGATGLYFLLRFSPAGRG